MKDRPKITKVEVQQFETEFEDMIVNPVNNILTYEPGAVMTQRGSVMRIFTDIGITGEYGGGAATLPLLVGSLIGRNPLDREEIFNNAKLVLR